MTLSVIEFHTFNSKENRLHTVFLYGLPKISIEDMEAYNLTPSAITEINTRFSSVNNAVYKVQFTRKNFNPKSLHNVTAICNVIEKRDNPTQYWNCLIFGDEHCNRITACMICANRHRTEDYPLRNKEKIPAVFSCFNCKKTS